VVIRGVVFDVDDTLYLERDYVRSGFQHVARIAGSGDAEVAALGHWLWSAYEAGIRGDTFDRMLVAFPDVAERHSVPDLVAAYRRHEPAIRLMAGTADVLDGLAARGLRLGVLTDGPVESQSAKARALALDRWFDPIVLTAVLGPSAHKPGTMGFAAIAAAWSLQAEELVYVGDNPLKDFAGPRSLGWRTVRLRGPDQLHRALEAPGPAFEPQLEIGSLEELPKAVR
jgi:putative hydrolase of the HAD superfamily